MKIKALINYVLLSFKTPVIQKVANSKSVIIIIINRKENDHSYVVKQMKKDSFPKRTVWESNFFRMGWIIFPFSAKRKLLPLISRSLKKKIVTAKSSTMSSGVDLFLKVKYKNLFVSCK